MSTRLKRAIAHGSLAAIALVAFGAWMGFAFQFPEAPDWQTVAQLVLWFLPVAVVGAAWIGYSE